TMMDGVKEESVGFLFNLDVQVDDGAAEPEPEPAELVGAQPQLDLTKLAAAQEEHDEAQASRPQIKAKGLDHKTEEKPLIYSSPELGSETRNAQTAGDGAEKSGQSATARRQQARQNPNRGSRGNKAGGGNRGRRKR